MLTMQGVGISKGVAGGPLYFLKHMDTTVVRQSVTDINAEQNKISAAQEASIRQLEALAEKCREEDEESSASLFETHAMLVKDEYFVTEINKILKEEQCNAEYALTQAGEHFAALFAGMDDDYMRERAADIRDVTRRILRNLMEIPEGGIDAPEPVILAADDISPSETLQLDRSKILGFLTQQGSGNSHMAILARTMGIPAICGLGDALQASCAGMNVWIDGETGKAVVEPDEEALQTFQDQLERETKRREWMETMKGQEDVTRDGKRIELFCNISSPQDIEAVLASDGQGIGLFRSEFLYLSSSDYPTEKEQFEAYRSVAEAMDGKRVVIRTCDIGSDKQAAYFDLEREANPAMGCRAIRFSLTRPEFFHTQLRAIYRASAYGQVAILFPMITSVWEVEACRQACETVMQELEKEGIPFNRDTQIGIMIETPASVWMAPELAKAVDFFSMGTNDLTQFTLACDRQNKNLDRFADPHHPAILRELKMAADAAHEAGIRICICGDLGADQDLLETFLAIGIDELSVAPAQLLPLRAALRACGAGNASSDLV